MSTAFKPLEITAGVVAKPTKNQRSSNWAEVHLMRWVEGQMSPVGGQSQYNFSFASRCKRIHGWFGLDQVYHIAFLCERHLYVLTGGALTDISPTLALTPPTLVGQGGYGDGSYNVGLQLATAGAWSAGATAITMVANPGWVQPTMDIFNVTKNVHVGKVLTYTGTALTLAAGADNAGSSGDQLMFDWYGKPRAINPIVAADKAPTAYSLDNFGSILYAMTSADGRLLMWDPAVGGKAVVQPAASGRGPVPGGRCFVVTNERFIMIFGTVNDGTVETGKQNRFAWCDQENPGAWDYTNITSQAGYLDIEPASPIICAATVRNGVILFTAKKAYNSQFLGMPYIYNYVELGENCTPWSPQSITKTSSMAVWMSKQGMFSFDGTSILPMNCLVRPWVDSDIDLLQVREQACMVHVGDFNEVWWFFPQDGFSKNSRCIIYSYKEGWWSMGRMARTAGITSSYTAHTIMADDLIAFQHEVPFAYPANVDLPWAETFDLNLNSGGTLTTVKQLIPDIKGAVANVLYSLFYRTSRSLAVDANGNVVPAAEAQTPPKQVRSNGYVDFRTTGRDIRLKIEIGAPPGQARPDVRPVTVGQHLIDSVPRGDR